MNACFDSLGYLKVERIRKEGKVFAPQICPKVEDALCGDQCPLLLEYVGWDYDDSGIIIYPCMVQLGCASTTTYYTIIKDEREESCSST